MDGVAKVNVNFAAAKAAVDFDETKANEEKIIEAIKKSGYGVGPAEVLEMQHAPGHDHEKMMRDQELKALNRKVFVGAVLSLLVFWGSFPEFFPWTPSFLQNRAILFLLATPVQFWVGWQFYRGFYSLLETAWLVWTL